jgi:hypothetical protein
MNKIPVQPLTELVAQYGKLFPEVLADTVQPVYNFDLESVFDEDSLEYMQALGEQMPLQIYTPEGPRIWRGPLPGQQHVIAGMFQAMQEGRRRFILRGETGVGKTQIQLMLLDMADRAGMDVYPAVIVQPRRVLKQWRERVKAIIPNSITMKIERPIDAEVFASVARLYHGKKAVFGVIPYSMISRGPGYSSAYRIVGYNNGRKDGDGHYIPSSPFALRDDVAVGCPVCFTPMMRVNIPGAHLKTQDLKNKKDLEALLDRGIKVKCKKCGSPLYEAVRPIPPGKDASARKVRFDVGEYMFRNWKRLSRAAGGKLYRSLVLDEVHKIMNSNSIRGETCANMSSVADNLFGLGATIYGGTASSIFWLYFMFHPEAWYEWGPLPVARAKWFDELANTAEVTKEADPGIISPGGMGKMRTARPRVTKKEVPAAPPKLIKMLAERTIHVKLQNLGVEQPPLTVGSVKVKLDDEHQFQYEQFFQRAIQNAIQHKIGAFASMHLQSAITYPIAPWQERHADYDPNIKVFPESYICAPERELIRFVKEELEQKRKTIIYITHTDIRDIANRIIQILGNEGVTGVRLPKTLDRELVPEWLADEASKFDTVILNQRSVEGVDAIKFQNVFFYELDSSVYPVTQASGRHWRLGQTEPCKTVFMEVEKTLLHRILAIVMQRMAAASMVYGDDIDAHIGQYSANTVLVEAAKQEMAGAALPDLDKLFKKAADVITKGMSDDDDTGLPDSVVLGPENDPESKSVVPNPESSSEERVICL